jgi:sugar phosphate isomerase/epimerase
MVQHYRVPVTAIHVPCLVITQPVWGWNPITKLERSVDLAKQVGARTVVVHPPFRWQREYEARFRTEVRRFNEANGGEIEVAVENISIYQHPHSPSTPRH